MVCVIMWHTFNVIATIIRLKCAGIATMGNMHNALELHEFYWYDHWQVGLALESIHKNVLEYSYDSSKWGTLAWYGTNCLIWTRIASSYTQITWYDAAANAR